MKGGNSVIGVIGLCVLRVFVVKFLPAPLCVFAPLREIFIRVNSRPFAVGLSFFHRSDPINARIFARTSANCSEVTRPFRRAYRLRQSRLFT